ncbi:hypothetical protein [Sideroxydans sp. CL21]|nr:hypothetical protein [Sideroxydans sp. CL21]
MDAFFICRFVTAFISFRNGVVFDSTIAQGLVDGPGIYA